MNVNIESLISSKSLDELRRLQGLIATRIASFPADNIHQYVHVTPDFISVEMSQDLQQHLWDRLKATNSVPKSKSSVRYLWITNSGRKYKFSGHKALDPTPFLSDDPLLPVLDLINATLPPHQKLDSCLIAFYENGEIGVGFHDDSEEVIDQAHPMKNLNLAQGLATRDIIFKSKETSPYTGTESFTLSDCDMLTMEAGCQQKFVHKVPPQEISSGKRVLLSFRKAAAEAETPLPPLSSSKPAKSIRSRRNSLQLPLPPNKALAIKDSPPVTAPLSTLILGTSVTRPVNLKDTINLSRGGESIPDLIRNIKEYHQENGDRVPNNIIIHGGTKDLLKARRAQDLKPSLSELLQTTKDLYPSSKLYFLSLLPIDATREWKSPNKIQSVTQNVLAFNRLARYLCRQHEIYHIHTLRDFLMPDGDRVDRSLFRDHIHTSSKGTNLLQRVLSEHLMKPFPKSLLPPTKPVPSTKRTPMNLIMASPLPTTLPLDATPPKLIAGIEPTADPALDPTPLPSPNQPILSTSNVSSEVEITVMPSATSSPPPTAKSSETLRSPSFFVESARQIVTPKEPN